ncbi:MAG: hypothetical protein KBD29_00705 [Candidatus Magasanikbacteria bacterium]|nr:hypothetical protein [Candidatus Magasanikbacteria bacterium]
MVSGYKDKPRRQEDLMGRKESKSIGVSDECFDPQVYQAIVDMVFALGGDKNDLSNLLTNKLLLRQVGGLIAGEWRKTETVPIFWKTIRFKGGFSSGKDFEDAIKQMGGKVTPEASSMFRSSSFTVLKQEKEFDLVRISVADLTCAMDPIRPYTDSICGRAEELGLELCPIEMAAQLRLQYINQPKGEKLLIGSPMPSDGHAFCVEYDGKDLLLRRHSSSDRVDANTRCVFVLPRKKS